MLERGTICGYRGQRLTAGQKTRFLKHGSDIWPIQNVGYRLLYLRFMIFTEACFTLISKESRTVPPRTIIVTVGLKQMTSRAGGRKAVPGN